MVRMSQQDASSDMRGVCSPRCHRAASGGSKLCPLLIEKSKVRGCTFPLHCFFHHLVNGCALKNLVLHCAGTLKFSLFFSVRSKVILGAESIPGWMSCKHYRSGLGELRFV